MRRGLLATSVLTAPLLFSGVEALGDPALSARQIMERVDARYDGDNAVQDLEMVLVDRSGAKRVRRLRGFGRDVGDDEQSLVFFLAPADVEGTGFLTYDYEAPERDDDQWLYLPALKRTKRLASSDKSASFMGSDFSFADMTDRPLDHYDYKLIDESEVRGQPVWRIERVPNSAREREETGYEKSVVFVRKDNYVIVRAVHWLLRGGRLKYFDVERLEEIDGIWVPTSMTMTTKEGKRTLHRTLLLAHNVRFNQALEPDLFSIRRLEKGP